MRRFFTSTAAAVFLIAHAAFSATVRGRVISSTTGEPIVGAVVSLADLDIGTSADSRGRYEIALAPTGQQRLVASALGFLGDTASVGLDEQRIATVSFALSVDPIALPLTTITNQRVLDAERSSAFVATIRPSESIRQVVDVPELLDQSVGVRVRSMGGFGAFSTISVRGSTSDQVRVYLDGVPLNQAFGGGVNLSAIPLSTVESIDVYRGVIPPRFGGSGLGGVVDIRSKDAQESHRLHLGMTAGSFNTQLVSASATGSFGPVKTLIAVDLSRSANDFDYLDDNGTRHNSDDDSWQKRRNNSYQSGSVLARLAPRTRGNFEWSGAYHGTTSRKELPGNSTLSASGPKANLRNTRHLSEGQVRYHLPWVTTLEGTSYYSHSRDRFSDPLGQTGGIGRQATDDRTRSWGTTWSATTLLLPMQTASVHIGRQIERFTPDDTLITNPNVSVALFQASDRATWTGHISDELRLLSGRLTLTGQLGWQRAVNELIEEATTWKPTVINHTTATTWPRSVGLIADITQSLTLQANWGRYSRVPSFFELFGDRGQTDGNGLLKPEIGINRDLGFLFDTARQNGRVTRIRGEIAYFHNTVRDMILFWQMRDVSRAFNIGAAEIRGIETSAEIAIGSWLSLSAHLVWQNASNRSTLNDSVYYTDDLPNRPRWEALINPALRYGEFELTFEALYHGKFYGQPDNETADIFDAQMLHNSAIRWRPKPWLSTTLETKNISGARGYHDRVNPLPGRSLFLSVTADY